MTILHDAGVTKVDSEQLRVQAQQLPVLREAAGFDMMFYRTQVETKVDGA